MVIFMRRIVMWLASTVTVLVLLFGYHTSTNATSPANAASSPPTSSASSGSNAAPPGSKPSTGSSSGSSATGSSSGSSSSPRTSSRSASYTGDVASTRWGPVQVQITVRSGAITDVAVLRQPDGNPHDVEINDQALPILISETLDAQSADIDMVSGATVTSDGYVESLQAALDRAGI
jgi:uncharacterized protein with FMN-binding domain